MDGGIKTHPDGTPWEYPWDSWRDGPHFSVYFLRKVRTIGVFWQQYRRLWLRAHR